MLARTPRVLQATIPRDTICRAIALAQKVYRFPPEFDPTSFERAFVPRSAVTHRISVRRHIPAKRAAMRAHATQIDMDSPMFQLMAAGGGLGFGSEYYRIAKGEPVLVAGDLEQDLFAGLP